MFSVIVVCNGPLIRENSKLGPQSMNDISSLLNINNTNHSNLTLCKYHIGAHVDL